MGKLSPKGRKLVEDHTACWGLVWSLDMGRVLWSSSPEVRLIREADFPRSPAAAWSLSGGWGSVLAPGWLFGPGVAGRTPGEATAPQKGRHSQGIAPGWRQTTLQLELVAELRSHEWWERLECFSFRGKLS